MKQQEWRQRLRRNALVQDLPKLGTPGSRVSALHRESTLVTAISGRDLLPAPSRLTPGEQARFAALRWMGTVGAILIGFGGLGAGALPVVDNPYPHFPFAGLLSRMLQTSSIMVMVGVGLLVIAWALMAPFTGISLSGRHQPLLRRAHISAFRRTFAAWSFPLLFTAPLFTQDTYSYLAQGAITASGLDAYSAGPVDLLGADHPLARSVPFIWSRSPSPYGPVALQIGAVISRITDNSIAAGVTLHRVVSIAGVLAAGWALLQLSRRCGVSELAAWWLGILNPLTILHLIGGIHNEAIMLGLLLVGCEVALRGIDRLPHATGWGLFLFAGFLICCAGMVKVTGFVALGFTGMALARALGARRSHLATAVLVQVTVLLASIGVMTLTTGIGLGWITGQGGAAEIRSWMSITTTTGVVFSYIGMMLGLGDHGEAMIMICRWAGIAVAGGLTVRLLFATYRGTIHPLGGLGVATLVIVTLFPVVHPWYVLWAVVPLAAWANRALFRLAVVGYSCVFSLIVLPRGLGLPPLTVATIYSLAFLVLATFLTLLGWYLVRRGILDVR